MWRRAEVIDCLHLVIFTSSETPQSADDKGTILRIKALGSIIMYYGYCEYVVVC